MKRFTAILLLISMALALCAWSPAAADARERYTVEENTAENKATYPYIVRTETSIWYLAADDIELLGEDAFFDGLFEILLVKKPQDILDLGDIISSVLSLDFSGPNVSFIKSRTVRFTFDAPVAWTRDGEDGGMHREVLIRNCHPGIEIFV